MGFAKTITFIATVLLLTGVQPLFAQLNQGQDTVLTLEKCRRMGWKHDQNLRAEKKQTVAYGEQASSAKKDRLPQLDGIGSYQYLGEAQGIQLGNVPVISPDGMVVGYVPGSDLALANHHFYQGGLELNQPLFLGNRLRNNQRRFSALEKQGLTRENIRINDLTLEIDTDYWDVISSKELLILAKKNEKLLAQLVENIQNRYEAQVVSKNDLLMAQVRHNESKLELIRSNNRLKLSKIKLNQILGADIDASFAFVDSITVKLEKTDPDKDYIEQANGNRPEIDYLNMQLSIHDLTEKLTKGKYLPSLSVGVSGYYARPNPELRPEGGFNWSAGASLSIPIYRWNKRRNDLNYDMLQKNKSELALEKTREYIALEVKQAIFNLNESYEKVKIAEFSLTQADENLRVSKENYEVSLVSILALLDAQTYWQEAYATFITSKAEYRLNQTKLERALGVLVNDYGKR
ncbi:hypothetical protein FUAX_48320 (plasmid) [Fulvitalea axinellae]|uniref:TolC family protein n=2 Tax=Fulvitalea axinellae TaxID=1182444 RepID=A0AAU9DMI0_9BACT|nr:hypothetical protein FUAX_48320 [Fulvitalea axinellae]